MAEEFTIKLVPDDEGNYAVEVPELADLGLKGATREETETRIAEAFERYLASRRAGTVGGMNPNSIG